MRTFAAAYPISLIEVYNDFEAQIKFSVAPSVKLVSKLLNADNEQFVMSQQAVAQLQTKKKAIVQQVAAQLRI